MEKIIEQQQEIVSLREQILESEKRISKLKRTARIVCFWVSLISVIRLLVLVLLVNNNQLIRPYNTIIYITMGICCLVALFTSSIFEVLHEGTEADSKRVHTAKYHLSKAEEELIRIRQQD